jgi:SNF2 family DNA or RNA helicase
VPRTPRLDLFFRGILGAHRDDDLWICRNDDLGPNELTVRIVRQLERESLEFSLVGAAATAVAQDVERVRSYQRVRESGAAFRRGEMIVEPVKVRALLDQQRWSHEKRSLRPHQQQALHHALTVANSANFSVPGSGKTVSALSVFAAHLAAETVDIAVVVGPLSSFAPWEEEARAALPETVRITRVRGTNRLARLEIYQRAVRGDLLLLTYPTVPADLHGLKQLAHRHRIMLIVDESHRVKRFRGGLWATSVVELARLCRVKMILSGTPMPQKPEDLYSQLNILWPGGELTGSRAQFSAQATNFPALTDHISPFYIRTPKAALGIPPYQVVIREAPMPPIQREVYELILSRFRRLLQDAATWQDKIAILRRGRPIRMIQAASNPDLLNHSDGFFILPPIDSPGGSLMSRLHEYRQREVPAKFLVALELLRGQVAQGRKTVVWTSFVRNIDQFAELARKALGVPVLTVDGRVPADIDDEAAMTPWNPAEEIDETREQRIRRFKSTDEPAILLANPAACGESISLHEVCRTAIYLDRTYDCARYLQSVDRIHRLGLPPNAKVTIHLLEATAGQSTAVDRLIRNSLARKQARMERLLEGGELIPQELWTDDMAGAQGDAEDLTQLLRYLLGE